MRTTSQGVRKAILADHGARVCALMAAALLPLLLSACATEEPKRVLRYDIQEERDPDRLVWPPSPEVPRFVYLGELRGKQNLEVVEEDKNQGLGKVFGWILGLGQEKELPVVLQRPQSGVVDKHGRILITDMSRQAVYVFDENNGKMHIWDRALEGVGFVAPIGIALDAEGNILVADAELAAVFRLSPEGKPLGQFGEGVLQRPTGIARDVERGHIYVADTRGNNIKVFNDQGELLELIGSSGDTAGRLNSPTYIAFAHGKLYVTDTLNARIQVFDRQGNSIRSFGQRGLNLGDFSRPKGIAVDDEGNVYVAEGYYDHLLVYDPQGRFLLPIGGTGNQPGQFYQPTGVWTDALNRVFVSDMFNGRVSVFQYLGST